MGKSRKSIELVRAEYINLYIGLLRKIGAPVDRELRRMRLPSLIEESADDLVSMDLAYRFVSKCAHLEGIDDIGFEAGWALSAEFFSNDMKTALRSAPSVKSRLEVFNRLLHLEDTGAYCELHPQGDMIRICIHHYTPPDCDGRIAEWLNLKAVIEIIRGLQGDDWLPSIIGLESRLPVPRGIQDRLPGIQILTGQSAPYIGLPISALTTSTCDYDTFKLARNSGSDVPGFNTLDANHLESRLSAALKPYLRSGYPSIDLAAEISGTSVRSLQRSLSQLQTSYSEIVERIRFYEAVQLLRDSELKIVEIALELGYTDSSNFSRAFRRIQGMSPRETRRQFAETTVQV
jgi:AraC-like DNA-binding protein